MHDKNHGGGCCHHHKHFIKFIFAGVMVVFALCAAFGVYFYSQSIQPDSYRSFFVTGEGEAVAVPDVAQFTFSVLTQGKLDIPALQKENTEKVNKVINFLKENGVDEKDIKTQNYNVNPRYTYYPCNEDRECRPPEITGYSINQSVLVKVRDFDKTGELLSGVVTNGSNDVSQLSFTIDDPTSVQNEAREEAIAKAKEKAEAIAKAGGFKIGKLLSIEEASLYAPQPYYSYESKALGIGGGGDVAPSIEPGSEEVKINVTLRYEIK